MTRRTQKLIYNLLIVCLLAGGIVYVCSRFLHLGNVVYTDNAQVRQHITPVNTRVPGFIERISFREYSPVHRATRWSSSKTASSASVWPRPRPTWPTR